MNPCHEEAVERAEPEGRNGEEVHRRNGFPVILQKGEPTSRSLWVSRRSFHPARNGSLNIETQHQQFAMDAGRSPRWILLDEVSMAAPSMAMLEGLFIIIPGDLVQHMLFPGILDENASAKRWIAILDKLGPQKPRFCAERDMFTLRRDNLV